MSQPEILLSKPKPFKIDWKDETHNLTKLYPRVLEEDGDDLPADGGSFFNFFELAEDVFDVSAPREAF